MTRHLIITVLALLVGYGLIEAGPLIIGPVLSVESPKNTSSFPGGIVTISGKASNIALLTLDGATLLHNESGDFSSTLTFPRGGSILTFTATDRFGRTANETRRIFVP
ncbi:MAG: hypothetical protein WAW90_01260 [Minisyncoccia bacterium]